MNKFNILENIKLDVHFKDEINDPTISDFQIVIFYNNEKIAYASFYHESGRLYSFEVFVEEDFRRMGIATKMYDYASELSQKQLLPHHENPYNYQEEDVSSDAILFWKNRKT